MHAFDVLGDPVRRRILELLAGGERAPGAVCAVIRDERGLATVRPEGARRGYAVNHEPLREVDAWLDNFRRFWAPPLEALATNPDGSPGSCPSRVS